MLLTHGLMTHREWAAEHGVMADAPSEHVSALRRSPFQPATNDS